MVIILPSHYSTAFVCMLHNHLCSIYSYVLHYHHHSTYSSCQLCQHVTPITVHWNAAIAADVHVDLRPLKLCCRRRCCSCRPRTTTGQPPALQPQSQLSRVRVWLKSATDVPECRKRCRRRLVITPTEKQKSSDGAQLRDLALCGCRHAWCSLTRCSLDRFENRIRT